MRGHFCSNSFSTVYKYGYIYFRKYLYSRIISNWGGFPGTAIGTLASTTTGTLSITGTIPAGTTAGAYRIRVKSSNPAVIGSDNGANITLNNPVAPTETSPQIFCSSPAPTVANLTTTTGSGIQWYSAASGGSALPGSTVLTNGTHYYASQSVSGCEGWPVECYRKYCCICFFLKVMHHQHLPIVPAML